MYFLPQSHINLYRVLVKGLIDTTYMDLKISVKNRINATNYGNNQKVEYYFLKRTKKK